MEETAQDDEMTNEMPEENLNGVALGCPKLFGERIMNSELDEQLNEDAFLKQEMRKLKELRWLQVNQEALAEEGSHRIAERIFQREVARMEKAVTAVRLHAKIGLSQEEHDQAACIVWGGSERESLDNLTFASLVALNMKKAACIAAKYADSASHQAAYDLMAEEGPVLEAVEEFNARLKETNEVFDEEEDPAARLSPELEAQVVAEATWNHSQNTEQLTPSQEAQLDKEEAFMTIES